MAKKIERKRIHIALEENIYKELEIQASRNGISVNAYINLCIREKLDKENS